MKFGHVIEYNKRYIFNNHAENEAGRLAPDLMFFKKSFIWEKSDLWLSFNVLIVSNLPYHINQLYETLEYWSGDMFDFDF